MRRYAFERLINTGLDFLILVCTLPNTTVCQVCCYVVVYFRRQLFSDVYLVTNADK